MKKNIFIELSLVILYLFIHLWGLVSLPVFADESIYIRWAQLMMDNWHQYVFFPLNDGKTPLFIWSLIPFQFLFQDQLFAARLVSVIVGLIQMFVVKVLIKELGGREKAQWLGMLLVTILPFWYIYHRLALMDGMLTLFISLTIWAILKLVHTKAVKQNWTHHLGWSCLAGIFLGAAIWTKIPALFVIPALPFFALLEKKISLSKRRTQFLMICISILISLVTFASLRISPAFGQLFHRSADFTWPVNEVLFQGKWHQTLASFPNYLLYFLRYISWPILGLAAMGFFINKQKRLTSVFLILISALSVVFVLFGKVVYARYFLPITLPMTILACLNAQVLYDRFFTHENHLAKKALAATIATLLFGSMIQQSFEYILPNFMDVTTTPYVSSDQEQFLLTWSSGIGIPETVNYIREQSQSHTIAVATEGRFGTLPDGLLLYFHHRDVSHIYIEGTAEYPVKDLPNFFVSRAKKFDQAILVVNSDRMQLPLPTSALIAQYCRPQAAPCLQIWDITKQVKNQ